MSEKIDELMKKYDTQGLMFTLADIGKLGNNC